MTTCCCRCWLKKTLASFCAWRAGEVSGLKYVAGRVKALSTLNWGSRGVTAGETSGVNAIYRHACEFPMRSNAKP